MTELSRSLQAYRYLASAGYILASLDRFHDLSSALRSHSIFHAAYEQHNTSIDACILENRIPAKLLPYAYLLLKSLDVQPKNTPSVLEFLTLYRDILTRRTQVPRLTGRRVAFLCRQYAAIEFLGEEYAEYATDNLGRAFCIWNNHSLTPAEEFRIHRALFRHQIHVNALCHQGEESSRARPHRVDRVVYDALHRDFYGVHVPWVNRQYAFVHEYITRRLEQAVIVTASYDVYWALERGSWCLDFIRRRYLPYVVRPAPATLRAPQATQHSLGLPFLAKVLSGHGYDHWIKYLQPKPADYHPPWELTDLEPTVQWGLPRPFVDRRLFVREADDAHDGLETGPAQAWIEAHKFKGAWDQYLWEAGYAMWDLPGHTFSRRGVFVLKMYRMQNQTGGRHRTLVGFCEDGGEATVEMRRRIWRRGGRGFYRDGDFSGVKGLTKEDIAELQKGAD